MIHVYCNHCGNNVRMTKMPILDNGHKQAYQCTESCNTIIYISKKVPEPHRILFSTDGLTYVFNKNDILISEYNETHKKAIELLNEDGIDWLTIPKISGEPKSQ